MSILQWSPQQLLVNKAACWGCRLWVAAIFFFYLWFWSWSTVSCRRGPGLFYMRKQHLDPPFFTSVLLSFPWSSVCFDGRGDFPVFHSRAGVSLKLASNGGMSRPSRSCLIWFDSCKMRETIFAEGSKRLFFFKRHLSQSLKQTISPIVHIHKH